MDGLKRIPLSVEAEAAVTTMRQGDSFGADAEELRSGNMVQRLCNVVGNEACKQVCQLSREDRAEAGVLCAENNIAATIEELGSTPEHFVIVAAIQDRVLFGDDLDSADAKLSPEGYTQVPDCNAFFFKPTFDGDFPRVKNTSDSTKAGRTMTHIGMRMADCGSVLYEFTDKNGALVLGQAHFSRTNMCGPSAYKHEVDGNPVSWSEYVLHQAVQHYGADPKTIKVTLAAAVEGKDFIHHYADKANMEKHYPGWEELGFMHPESDTDFDCLIDYREMIEWQLKNSIQNPALQLDYDNITVDGAINTGDIALGHASHHWASNPKNKIEHGRDLYIVGLNKKQTITSRVKELEYLQDGRSWTLDAFPDMDKPSREAFEESLRSGFSELYDLRHQLKVLERGV